MPGSMALIIFAMHCNRNAPYFFQISLLADLLLIALRCLMSFSVSGEYTGVVAYLIEGAKESGRGLNTSRASAASEVGAPPAGGAGVLSVGAPEESLVSWG